MWKVLGQWAYGLCGLAKGQTLPLPKAEPWWRGEIGEALRGVAFVNLKKTGGSATADPKEVSQYIEQDWDLLLQQITEMNPDIVVCGSTWSLIEARFPGASASGTSRCVHRAGQFVFVDFWHPSNRFPPALNYYALLGMAASCGVVATRLHRNRNA